MILLMTTSPNARDCADAIAQGTSELVKVATTARQASVFLKEGEFAAVIVDLQLLENDPAETENALSQIGVAASVHINLAISGTERVIRELRIATRRREGEMSRARDAAEQELRNKLKDVVTALLLCCEMTLDTPSLPLGIEGSLRKVDSLVREIQQKIGLGSNSQHVANLPESGKLYLRNPSK